MTPDELEREIGDALRRLPAPRAPATLAPRVMRAVAAAASREAGWRRWRLEWQLLSVCATGALALALVVALPLVEQWIAALPAARAVVALWDVFVAPVAAPFVAWTAVMCTACALLIAGLKHVAWEGQEVSRS
jgi:hypothetical protein